MRSQLRPQRQTRNSCGTIVQIVTSRFLLRPSAALPDIVYTNQQIGEGSNSDKTPCQPRRRPTFTKGDQVQLQSMHSATYDVIIIGSGIVGAACADEFARRGMSVAIVERDVVGGGATAAGMGHIVVMDDSEAQFALTRYSQQLWRALRTELPPDVEYEPCGTIWVAADEEEMAEVLRKHEYYAKRGVPTEVLDWKRFQQMEPNVREGMAGGLLVPQDGVLYPPCAARFLIERAQKRGANLRLGASVAQIA